MSDASSLPAGWAITTIGEITADRVPHAPPRAETVPYIDISSIDRERKAIGTLDRVTPANAPTRARQWVQPGDVLVSMTRPNLNAVARVLPEHRGAVASTGFDVLRSAGVVPEWLFYRVRSHEFVTDLCRGLQGVVYPAVRPHDVRRHRIPVPPEPEQRRIVSSLESYLSRLDDAVTTLERVRHNLKRYRASVLKAAVEGRLVPAEAEVARNEGRDYEPASVLLGRILAERRRRWEEAQLVRMKGKGRIPRDDRSRVKYPKPAEADLAGLPELPEGWCWTTLDQLSWSVKDGPHYSPEYSSSGIPFITGGNVRPHGVDFESAKYISPELHAELSKRVCPERNDILYTKGGTTGIARVNTYDRPFNVWVHVAVLKLVGLLNPFYLQHALNSPWCYGQAQKYTHGVGNQDLGLTRMVKITVPLPPAPEQRRIAAEVDRLASLGDEIEGQMSASAPRLKAIRQAMIKWAFEGRLVEQDPNDEPASALLERIRTARANAEKQEASKRPRRTRKER